MSEQKELKRWVGRRVGHELTPGMLNLRTVASLRSEGWWDKNISTGNPGNALIRRRPHLISRQPVVSECIRWVRLLSLKSFKRDVPLNTAIISDCGILADLLIYGYRRKATCPLLVKGRMRNLVKGVM